MTKRSAAKTTDCAPPYDSLTTDCAHPPYFDLLKILFLVHHVTARLETMMEKRIITFKHNYPLTFSRFFAKLLSTNCCRHVDAMMRLINMPLRMCRGRET